MIRFHLRPGVTPGAVSEWLLKGMAEVDFRVRLGAPLTFALAELMRSRHEGAAAADDPALADSSEGLGVPATFATAELVAAREAQAAPARTARAPARPVLGLAVRLRRPLAIGIALVAVTGGATASSLWLAPAGNRIFGYNPGLVSTQPPAAQLGALAVLRRPQTDGERGPGVQAALADVNNFTTGVRSDYVRVLEQTRNGAVVLIPVSRRAAIAEGPSPQPAIDNALCVYYPFSGPPSLNNSTHCWSTQQLLAGQALAGKGDHEYGLVPDSASSVLAALGSWRKSVPVTGNFFDVTLPIGIGTSAVPMSPTITFSPSAT